MDEIEGKINSPAFKACARLLESCGPFSNNPGINKAYITLRLLGFSAQETRKIISDEVVKTNNER